MIRISRLLLALLALASPTTLRGDAPASPETPKSPRLLLANGDFAVGELVDSSNPNELAWQCEALTEKLTFPLAAISAAYFPQPKEPGKPGEFSIELVGGDAITGALAAVTDDRLEMDSARLGRISIDRNQIRRVVKLNHKGETFFSGPNGLAGWSSSRDDHPWKDEGGQLAAAAPGMIFYADCKIPSKVSVDFEASWQQKASFSFHVGSEGKTLSEVVDGFGNVLGRNVQVEPAQAAKTTALFSLETWGDWIVVVRETPSRADVAPVVRVEEGPGRVHLRMLFDREAGKVSVYSADGKLLGEATAPEEELHVSNGLRLENKKGDLRIEYLAVHSWFGEAPRAVDAGRSYLQTSQGDVHYCDSLAFDAATNEFVVTAASESDAEKPASGDGGKKNDEDAKQATPAGEANAEQAAPPSTVAAEPLRIPAQEVTVLSFRPTETVTPASMRVALYDGSRISGELEAVADGRLRLRRAGIDKPLELPVADLRLLASLIAKPPEAKAVGRAGRLDGANVRLHGWLLDSPANESDQAGKHPLRWQPLLSPNSSPLVRDFSGVIVYRDPPRPAKAQKTPEQRRLAARPQAAGVFQILQAVGAGAPIRRDPVLMNSGSPRDKQLLWLRAGDRLPCTIESIDDRGVTFKSTAVAATFLPHDAIKAWEREGGRPPRKLDDDKRERLLTLPRMQRANPPTHLIESNGGDYLRGQLEELNSETVLMNIRLETKRLPVDDIASIVWFDPLKPAKDNKEADADAKDAAAPDDESAPAVDAPAAEAPAGQQAAVIDLKKNMQAVRADGVRLTFEPHSVEKGVIDGDSRLLGKCHVDVREVDQLLLGEAIGEAAEELAYHQWRLKSAVDPQFVNEGSESGSASAPQGALADKPAPDFRLDLLAEGEHFNLGDQRGKVVVLDFWASWCGPCMQSLPKLHKLARELENQDVRFIAVNMQEDRATVADALERLEINLEVALDVDGATGEKYSVSAIPHTVVIDRNGIVAASLIGGGPDVEQQLRDAIAKSLESPAN